eukprot:CAMPEP_0118851852 /NCGR_PEP_ID=MMETSP1163-20130328/1127_1 /TAXON_ID=124430 /ORGANISM="Phaeomonas parva, Strain CCMP2877" /LENGTH=270 /DNA_ID=CAMNT_0006784241 /DNA_START=285 /DNA_END=1093 /DNA_ORIENTATION=-
MLRAWAAAAEAEEEPKGKEPPAPEATPEAKQEAKEAGKEEGEEEEEEEKEPETIADWLVEQSPEESWTKFESFHDVYVNAGQTTVLLAADAAALAEDDSPLFFVNLTKEGVEGGLRNCWNATPKNVGLRLQRAPAGDDVWLCEEPQRGAASDLAATMRGARPDAPLAGFIAAFAPLVELEEKVVLDLTSWFFSFADLAKGRGGFEPHPDNPNPNPNPTPNHNAWERQVAEADRKLFAGAAAAAPRCATCGHHAGLGLGIGSGSGSGLGSG